jgi:hypothetical protein
MPVEIVKALDCVEIETPVEVVVVAVMRTVVATVPPVTTVCIWPLASVLPEVGVIVMPPTVVLGVNVTGAFGLGPPELSRTLNTTVEVAVELPFELAPVPLSVMLDGVADTNSIEPIVAAATLIVPVAVKLVPLTTAVAVMGSLVLQPVAT